MPTAKEWRKHKNQDGFYCSKIPSRCFKDDITGNRKLIFYNLAWKSSLFYFLSKVTNSQCGRIAAQGMKLLICCARVHGTNLLCVVNVWAQYNFFYFARYENPLALLRSHLSIYFTFNHMIFKGLSRENINPIIWFHWSPFATLVKRYLDNSPQG